MTLQYAVYIVPALPAGGDILGVIQIWSVVVEYEPNGSQQLAGDGDIDFQSILPSDDGLPVAELVEEAPLRPGSYPMTSLSTSETTPARDATMTSQPHLLTVRLWMLPASVAGSVSPRAIWSTTFM